MNPMLGNVIPPKLNFDVAFPFDVVDVTEFTVLFLGNLLLLTAFKSPKSFS